MDTLSLMLERMRCNFSDLVDGKSQRAKEKNGYCFCFTSSPLSLTIYLFFETNQSNRTAIIADTMVDTVLFMVSLGKSMLNCCAADFVKDMAFVLLMSLFHSQGLHS